MIRADKARDQMNALLSSNSAFEVISFDRRAATECALSLSANWTSKNQRAVSKTKFKFDWMIVACAASRNVETIYSDDADIKRIATSLKIRVIQTGDLTLSDSERQIGIDGI